MISLISCFLFANFKLIFYIYILFTLAHRPAVIGSLLLTSLIPYSILLERQVREFEKMVGSEK